MNKQTHWCRKVSECLTAQKRTQQSGDRVEGKNSCARSKAADSPQFFQLWTAAANSAHSAPAYSHKAACQITTGILSPSPFPPSLCLAESPSWCVCVCSFALDETTTCHSLPFNHWSRTGNAQSKISAMYLHILNRRAPHVPTPPTPRLPPHVTLCADSVATLWLLLWRCQWCLHNKGRPEPKQPLGRRSSTTVLPPLVVCHHLMQTLAVLTCTH